MSVYPIRESISRVLEELATSIDWLRSDNAIFRWFVWLLESLSSFLLVYHIVRDPLTFTKISELECRQLRCSRISYTIHLYSST